LRTLATTVPLPELLRATLARSGYAQRIAREPDAEDRVANLEELISAAGEISPTGDQTGSHNASSDAFRADGPAAEDASAVTLTAGQQPRVELATFLDHIALLTDADNSRGSDQGVRLMTVHAAKGLEFDRVFLVGMEEELFPHMSAIADGQLEEERRLCYVGMTRARRSLYLSAARSRRIHGRERWQEPSRFIHEIDPRFIIVRDNLAAIPDRGAAAGPGSQRKRGRSSGLAASRAAAGSRARAAHGAGPQQQPGSARPAEDADLQEGVRVLHAKFGAGKITSRQGAGEKLKLVIRFTRAGTKTVLARYAKLEILG
jgi:DNA helicase-2/ATP-dependent DNA helicase PcrA